MKVKDIISENTDSNKELVLIIYKIENNKKIPVAKFRNMKKAYEMLDDIRNEYPDEKYKLEYIQQSKTLYESNSDIQRGTEVWKEVKRAMDYRGPSSDPLHNARLNFDGIIIPLSKDNGDLRRLYRWVKNHLGNNEQNMVFSRLGNLAQLDNLIKSFKPPRHKDIDEAKRKKKRKVSRRLPRVYGGWFGFGTEGGEGGVEESVLNKETLTPEELSKLHNVSVEGIKKQLFKGMKVELEHTTDKKVAMEIALDHLKEDPKYYDKLTKAKLEETNIYFQNPTKTFNNFDEEFNHIMNIKELDVKLHLLEMLASKDNLNESVFKINDDIKKVVNSLVDKFSSKNLEIGNKYIPVQIGIYQGHLMLFDIENNYPPIEKAKFGILDSMDKKSCTLDFSGRKFNYPFTNFMTYTGSAVLLIDSEKKYNDLKLILNLKYDINLPSIEKNELTENPAESVWMVMFIPKEDVRKQSAVNRRRLRHFYKHEDNALQAATILRNKGHDVYTPVEVTKKNMSPLDKLRDEGI